MTTLEHELRRALEHGNVDEVRILLNAGATVKYRDGLNRECWRWWVLEPPFLLPPHWEECLRVVYSRVGGAPHAGFTLGTDKFSGRPDFGPLIEGSLSAWRDANPRATKANVAGRTDLRDADCAALVGLKAINISGCKGLSDGAFPHFRGCHTLHMQGCGEGVTDSALFHLAGVFDLDLSHCGKAVGLTGTSFRWLAGIHTLNISHTSLGAHDAACWTHLQGCMKLSMVGCHPTAIASAHRAGLSPSAQPEAPPSLLPLPIYAPPAVPMPPSPPPYAGPPAVAEGGFPLMGISLGGIKAFVASLPRGRASIEEGGVTTREVYARYIKTPRSPTLSYCSELSEGRVGGSRHVGRATVFVCHAHATPFLDLVDALEGWEQGRVGSGGAAGTARGGPPPGDTYFWVDVFCHTSGDEGGGGFSSRPMEWWRDVLAPGMGGLGRALVVMDVDAPLVLERLWCVWEMSVFLGGGGAVEFIMPPSSLFDFRSCIVSMYDAMSSRLGVSVEGGKCHFSGEEGRLREVIWATRGPQEVARLVGKAIKEWMVGEGLVALSSAFPPSEAPRSSLQMEVALELEGMGRLEEAGRLYAETMEACRVDARSEGGMHVGRAVLAGRHYARVLRAQGEAGKAEPLLRDVLTYLAATQGALHSDTLATKGELAEALGVCGRVEESVSLYREVYSARTSALGPTHKDTLDSAVDLSRALHTLYPSTPNAVPQRYSAAAKAAADEATHLLSMVLEVRKAAAAAGNSDGSLATLDATQALAGAFRRQGLLAEASSRLALVVLAKKDKLGTTHSSTLEALVAYAEVLVEEGKLEEGAARYREAIEGRQRALSASHPFTLALKHGLADVLLRLGKPQEAEPLLQEAAKGRREAFGDAHPSTLTSQALLADTLMDVGGGRGGEALALYRAVLTARQRVLRPNHPSTLETMNNLGSALRDEGDLVGATTLYREALEGRRAELGDTHPSTLISIHNYAAVLADVGKLGEAAALYTEALAGQKGSLGPLHPSTLTSTHNLGLLLRHQGRLGEAARHFQEATAGRVEALGQENPDTLASMGNCGEVLRSLGGEANLKAALPLFRTSYTIYRSRAATGRETLQLGHGLGCVLRDLGEVEEAGEVFREVLECRRRVLGGMHEDTLDTINEYAALLKVTGRIDEAAPLGVYKEAMVAARRTLGKEHPDALAALKAYAKLLYVSTETDFADWLRQIREEERGVGSYGGSPRRLGSSPRGGGDSMRLTPKAAVLSLAERVASGEIAFPGTPLHRPPTALLSASSSNTAAAGGSGAARASATISRSAVERAALSPTPPKLPLSSPPPPPPTNTTTTHNTMATTAGFSASTYYPPPQPLPSSPHPSYTVPPPPAAAAAPFPISSPTSTTTAAAPHGKLPPDVPPHILEQYARYQQQQQLIQTQAQLWQQHQQQQQHAQQLHLQQQLVQQQQEQLAQQQQQQHLAILQTQLAHQQQQQQHSFLMTYTPPAVLPSSQVPYVLPQGHVASLVNKYDTGTKRKGGAAHSVTAVLPIREPEPEEDDEEEEEEERERERERGRRREEESRRRYEEEDRGGEEEADRWQDLEELEAARESGRGRGRRRGGGGGEDFQGAALRKTLKTHLPMLHHATRGERHPVISPFADVTGDGFAVASRLTHRKEDAEDDIVKAITNSLRPTEAGVVEQILEGLQFH